MTRADVPTASTYRRDVSKRQGFLDISHTPDLCACLALLAYFVAVVAIAWMGG